MGPGEDDDDEDDDDDINAMEMEMLELIDPSGQTWQNGEGHFLKPNTHSMKSSVTLLN